MGYFDFDYKFERDKTPLYDYASWKYSCGDPQMPLKIKEALENIGVRTNNVEMEHNSLELYPTISINGTIDPDVVKKYAGFTVSDFVKRTMSTMPFFINKVIFNPPATVILWADGTKTVVKCGEHDEFDPEKGLVMAITKKLLGNKGNYYNVIKSLLKEAEYQYSDKDDVHDYRIPKTVLKRFKYKRISDKDSLLCPEAYFECPVCGDEILKSGARYCANCGQRLIWEEK